MSFQKVDFTKQVCYKKDNYIQAKTGVIKMHILKWLLKAAAAGIAAIAILCGLLCFYDIVPVHEENKKGNTDYVWPANSVWVKATEGIAFGKFDANGFNNITITDDPDIIVLGSSHMEATNVMQSENAACLLSKKLEDRYSVYNMGISDHNFFKVCQYLPVDLELFDPVPKVVIIETSTVRITKKKADKVISSSLGHVPSHSSGIVGMLQKIPFFRAVYHQVKRGLLHLFMPESGSPSEKTEKDADAGGNEDVKETKIKINTAAYEEIFSYLMHMEEKYGTQIIIVFHPTEKLMEDGTIFFDRDEHLRVFSSYAIEYGISFIDMSDRFEKMFYEENHVAHGFCTGKIAAGHLNKYGHAAVADELYNEICRLEEAGELCR